MQGFMAERIDYGRRIRSEADAILARHGNAAVLEARSRAERAGLTEADAAFLAAVADRVSRLATLAPKSEVA